MCWNADISINTFVFVCFSLLFIYFTNTYTKYKTPFFDNPLMYLFVFSVASMQLIEFFLWRNLNNKPNNYLLSNISLYVVIFQQIILIYMIPSLKNRRIVLSLYLLILLSFTIYYTFYKELSYYTSVGKNGHLSWGWMNHKGYDHIWNFMFLSFYIVPAFLINNSLLFLSLSFSMAVSIFFYYKYKTFGSMWCWLSNALLLYFLINILFIQPYYEYNSLC